MTAVVVACVKPINDGNACFQSTECNGGSVCAATVYGKYCMQRCDIDTVRCEPDFEACLLSSDVGFGGMGGDSGFGGMGGDSGFGGMGGVGGMGGMGGAAGAGGTDMGSDIDAGPVDPEAEEIWVCLPGRLENPNFIPRVIGQICDYSIDCVTGGVCVCIPGATCSGQGKNGPTCEELCDPSVLIQCPRGLACTDLGNGRGFCDPSTFEEN